MTQTATHPLTDLSRNQRRDWARDLPADTAARYLTLPVAGLAAELDCPTGSARRLLAAIKSVRGAR